MSAPFGTVEDVTIKARPDSVPVGIVEHRIWQPFGAIAVNLGPAWARKDIPTKKDGWNFKDAVLGAAKKYDYETKMPGDRRGKIGESAVKVLEAFFEIVDFMTGRMEPSIAAIAAQAKLARATVVAALKRLREEGFLSWVRRKESTGNEGAGPQIHQATNAYHFKLRRRAAGLVRNALAKLRPPPPADAIQRGQDARAETARMLAQAPSETAARFHAGDSPLGDALAGLGRAIDSSANSVSSRNPDRKV